MTSLNHSSAVLWHHSQTAACALSLPPKLRTQCCVLVLSLHKLQIADEEHLTVYRPVSTGTTWSVPAHGNLPFCDSCPSASTTELGYDAAVLYSWGRLVVEWCTNSKLSDDNSRDSTVFFGRDFLDSWHIKMGPDRLSRNVGKELPLHAA